MIKFKERNINIHSNYGGLGDMIARLPAIQYILDNHPHIRMTVYWHDYFTEVAKILLPECENLRHKKTSEMAFVDDSLPLIDFDGKKVGINSLHMHLVEHAFLVLCNRLPFLREHFIYPRYEPRASRTHQAANLEDYIVIAPLFTAEAREWDGYHINDTIDGLHTMGYKTVLLGKSEPIEVGNDKKIKTNIPEGLDRSKATLDLIDKTSLLDCLEIISDAKAILGIDNGLMHLSACTSTPSVWGFTSVLAEHRLPQNIKYETVLPDSPWYGFQSTTFPMRNVDYRYLPKGAEECLNQMQAKKFLHAVQNLLDTR